MRSDENQILFDLLDGICETHGKPHLSPAAKTIWSATMQKFDIGAISQALTTMVMTSQFFPKPADVVALIAGDKVNDKRPGTEEAWAMASEAMDESLTAVLTVEIIGAMGAVRAMMLGRDQVAARKAFQEVYERMVREARQAGRPVVWQAQLGTDRDHQAQAIAKGIKSGRLNADKVGHLLPAPETNAFLMLENKSTNPETKESEREKALAMLEKLRQIIAKPSEAEAINEQKKREARANEEKRRLFLVGQTKGRAA